MARRQAKIELTLFPFLSVLCGLIAVLMLFMIVTVSTRVIDEGRRAEERYPVVEEDKQPESEPGEDESIDEKRHEQLRQQIDHLAGVLASRQRQQDELVRNVQQLEDLLESKKTELQVPSKAKDRKGARLGQPTPVNVVPVKIDDNHPGAKKKPRFIEVSATGYIVHPEKTAYPPIEKMEDKGKDEFVVDPALDKFLAEVDQRRQGVYLVFLIHPNGTIAWRNIMDHTSRKYNRAHPPGDRIDVGWEPFAREWLYIPQ